MNRLDELNALIDEAENVPDSFDINHIKGRTKKKVIVHRCYASARNLLVALLLLVVVIGVGVNTSTAFANAVENIPVVNNIAKMLNFRLSDKEKQEIRDESLQLNPDMEATLDYVTVVKQTAYSAKFDVETSLEYAFADEFGLVIYFKAQNIGDGLFFVSTNEIKDADTQETIETKFEADMAGNLNENELKLIRFYWDGFHENVDLKVNLAYYSEDGATAENDVLSFNIRELIKLDGIEYTPDIKYQQDDVELSFDKISLYPTMTVFEVSTSSENVILDGNLKFYLKDEHGNISEEIMHGTCATGSFTNGHYTFFQQSVYFKFSGKVELVLEEASFTTTEKTYEYKVYEHEASYGEEKADCLVICNKAVYDITYGNENENLLCVDDETAIGLPKLYEDCYYLAIPKSLGVKPEYYVYGRLYAYKNDETIDWEYEGTKYYVVMLAHYQFLDENESIEFASAEYISTLTSSRTFLIDEEYKLVIDIENLYETIPNLPDEVEIATPSNAAKIQGE